MSGEQQHAFKYHPSGTPQTPPPGRPFKALDANAPLHSYFRAISRIPLLSAEEEVQLARRIEAGRRKVAVAQKRYDLSGRSHDRRRLAAAQAEVDSAVARFVEANLRLVVKFAQKFTHRGLPMIDLIQEGNIGLMRAVERFDHRRGVKFSTYGVWWIRQAMTRATQDHGQTVRLPVNKIEAIARIHQAERALAREAGYRPSAEAIAAKLDQPVETVCDIIDVDARRRALSLDVPVGDSDTHLMHLIPDEAGVDTERAVIQRDLAAQLQSAMSVLSAREAEVLQRRFGIGRHHASTLQEIAAEFRLSRERIRQIQNEGIAKMKRRTSHRLAEFWDD